MKYKLRKLKVYDPNIYKLVKRKKKEIKKNKHKRKWHRQYWVANDDYEMKRLW
jgi:hypothetical protein